MLGKTDRFIVKPRIVEKLVYHDMERAKKEIGLPYKYMGSSMVPEADIDVGLQEVKKVPLDSSFVEPHKHDVSQFYGIIGDLTVEVTLEDEKHEVSGPASIFIPAGMMHTFRPLRGSGHVMIVLRRGEYG
jgi:mannose-6-phosphate isomerase-like protein (cupin superfamily)